jgi:transposase, IS5 family
LEMYEKRTHRVEDRIVSISQPHVRPIVRGKAGSKVEFGAKLSLSHVKDGYVLLDKLSWDAYNESVDLIAHIETYKNRFDYYPASVHADEIYRTRANRSYCKDKGIRLSGKALGRPKKQTAHNQAQLKAERKQNYQDELDRIPIEGKFGNAKRKGTLARIMAKLPHTSVSVIHIGLIILNLDKRLREVLCWLKIRCADCLTTHVKLSEKRQFSLALPRSVRMLLRHNLRESQLAA